MYGLIRVLMYKLNRIIAGTANNSEVSIINKKNYGIDSRPTENLP